MSLVLDMLRKNKEYIKSHEDDQIPIFSAHTNFQIYDYMTCERAEITGINGPQKYLNMGLGPGSSSIIAKSGVGKTSLAIKLGINIVKPYENSTIYMRDAEHTYTDSRAISLSGVTMEYLHSKMDYVRYGIDHDFIYNDIVHICQTKEALRNQLMIDTGMIDFQGKSIKIFPPDVYILDSLPSLRLADDDSISNVKTGTKAMMAAENMKDENVNKRIEGMQAAGSTKLLLNKLGDLLFKYNIRLLLINHIVKPTAMNTNSMYIQKQMQYLNQDESLPGGVAYLYQCINIAKLTPGSRIVDNEFGSMIDGAKNKIMFVKNKSNISGVPIELIYEQRTGYNSLLSSFNYIYNRQYGIEGNPRSFNFVDSNISFTKRTFWETLVKDFKNYGINSKLLKALLYTSNRCLYYDLVVGQPDPNPKYWGGSSGSKIDSKLGVTSK